MDHPILLYFVSLTIFTLMFALGVNHSFEQLTSLWRRPGLLLRSLLAVAILCMVVISLAIGHLLGGPRRDQRSALATACIARNIGLALFIAELSDYGHHFIPTLLTYMILGGLLAVPYAVWSKRQLTLKRESG